MLVHKKVALFGAAAGIALLAMQSNAFGAEATVAAGPATVTEVIVTANKRQENVQTVGMSIQAATGDKLTKLGITDTASLQKIVPGFVVTPNYYGTSVFTIRGVGFQDTSLASSPTVTVYADEAPLPFSILSSGATLDLQRVEVLKGPQGTLFGNNATGGAINYIANKPTDTFQAGMDVTVGNFATANVQGFVSGPIADGLDARIAIQSNNSGAWQKGYGQMSGQSIGGTDFLNGRVAVQWKPNDRFKALLTVRGWQDKGYNQIGQYAGTDFDRNQPPAPLEAALPLPPHNDQAAMWNTCVNTSPFDPLAGQNSGTLYYTPYNPDGTLANTVAAGAMPGTIHNGNIPITGIVPTGAAHGPNVESEGTGSLAQTGGQPTSCTPPRNNNDYFSGTLRLDYDLPMGMTLTSLSEFQRFNRASGVDGSGVPFNTYQSYQRGKIASAYQELRVAGKWWGKGTWIVGGNYEFDSSLDTFLETYNGGTVAPLSLPLSGLCLAYQPGGYDATSTNNVCTQAESPLLKSGTGPVANPNFNSTLYPTSYNYTLGPSQVVDKQLTNTYAVYASGEYPILDNLTLIGGVRYTEEDKKAAICNQDGGDGTAALVFQQIANLTEATSPVGVLNQQYAGASQTNPGPGGYISAIDAYLNGAGRANYVGAHGCAITGPAPDFQLYGNSLPTSRLNEHNISWRAGLNWKVQPNTLLYVLFSQGYKGGAFPTIAETTYAQNAPAKQESLLSYEAGFKGTWFDHQLTLNGAGFYYNYHNKQILGAVDDPVFGPLAELVNVPNSHVIGWELSGVWAPEFLKGLTITPSVAYQYSKVDTCTTAQSADCIGGHYHTASPFAQATDVPGASLIDVNGEGYPDAPVWGASVDAEYDWSLPNDIDAFVGANVNFTGSTHTSFVWQHPVPVASYDPLTVPAYTLLDLRAGIAKGPWRLMVWGHNVTNTYYWTSYDRVADTNVKYTGMPTTFGLTISYRYH